MRWNVYEVFLVQGLLAYLLIAAIVAFYDHVYSVRPPRGPADRLRRAFAWPARVLGGVRRDWDNRDRSLTWRDRLAMGAMFAAIVGGIGFLQWFASRL